MIPPPTQQQINDATTDAGATLAAGAALAATPTVQDVYGRPYLFLPDGIKATDLEHYLPAPIRLKQTVAVHTADALIAYVRMFGAHDRSIIFADKTLATLTAVLDYHATPTAPSWLGHRVVLRLAQTEAWKAWTAKNGKEQTQDAFAQFIEDHVPDIAEPVGTVLVEIARNFEATKGVSFKSVKRISDGSVTFSYDEDVKGVVQAGQMRVPTEFTVALAPFEGSAKYAMTARLRWRIGTSGLTLWFDLLRAEDVVEFAFNDVVKAVTEGTTTAARAVLLAAAV